MPYERRDGGWVLPLGLAMALAPAVAHSAPIAGAPPAAESPEQKQYPQEVRQAIESFESGEAAKAFELLRKATELHPQLAPARLMFANLYFSEGHDAAGRSQLELAVVEHLNDPEPHLIFGDIAVRERRISDAEAQYKWGAELLEKLSQDHPRRPNLDIQHAMGMARVAELRKQWDLADGWIDRVLRSRPDHPIARFRLAHIRFAQGRTEEAHELFESAHELDPRISPPAMAMAEAYRKSGDLQQTAVWLERAAGDSPQDARPRVALARLYWETNQLEKATDQARMAEQVNPDSLEAKLICGTVARFRGELPKAQEYFEQVLDKEPTSFLAGNQLALVLAEQATASELRRALDMALINVRADPESADAASTLGRVYYRLGKLELAEQHLRRALASGRAGRETAYYLAVVLADRGNLAEAEGMVDQALTGEGPFAYAEQARQLRDRLQRSSP
jgi:tetratricopeptide (TPR) repeat protein